MEHKEELKIEALRLIEEARHEPNVLCARAMVRIATELYRFYGLSILSQTAKEAAVIDDHVVNNQQIEERVFDSLFRENDKPQGTDNIGFHDDAEDLRRLGVTSQTDRARIEFWAGGLSHQRFLVEEEKLGDLAQTRILDNLERYGICHVRPVGLAPTRELVDSVIQMIGTPMEWQNAEPGPVKDIRPKPDINPNTGDSKGDLGFHVDGTQHDAQPPVLLFQYATGATLGAHSRFADAARIVHDFPEGQRSRILVNLARHDAATFRKNDGFHVGPIFSFSPTEALMCRIRFDDVIEVHKNCRQDFELLRKRFDDPYYSVTFQPRDGDVVVFDNWRVMHARTEVYGTRDRHHRRVWFANLKLEHQPRYYLGIRPIPRDVAAEIQEANGKRAS